MKSLALLLGFVAIMSIFYGTAQAMSQHYQRSKQIKKQRAVLKRDLENNFDYTSIYLKSTKI